MHTWRTAFELRAFTTKTIADWIGHQGAFRAYFAQVSVRYLTLHPLACVIFISFASAIGVAWSASE
jgi:hypothetical protein